MNRTNPLGCYGIGLVGLPAAEPLMVPLGPEVPMLTVRQTVRAEVHRDPERLDDESALLHLSDGTGTAEVHRDDGTVELLTTRRYDDESLLHPMLTGALAVTNHWYGRDSFHAGAFELDGSAWVVVGDKGMGKSTTLGYLAAHGMHVITDDLAVVHQGQVLAGPAFVDLRPDAAERFGAGRDLGVVGARARARLTVPVGSPSYPLAGWIVLSWGTDIAVRSLPVPRRLEVLYANRTVRSRPPDPASYLRHVSRPFYSLERPRDWSELDRMRRTLLSMIS